MGPRSYRLSYPLLWYPLLSCLAVAQPWPNPAHAQAQAVEPEAVSADATRTIGSPRSQAGKSQLMPEGALTIGADVSFLTARGGLGPDELRFTDVVLFRPRVRYSLHRRLEVFSGISLLPKQPSYTDDLVWQGGHVGALLGTSARTAVFVRGAGGPLLRDPVTDDLGWWAGGSVGLQARKALEEVIVFQGALGASGSRLWRPDSDDAFWLVEVDSHGEILFQTPRGEFGAWVGIDFRVPVASGPDAPAVPGGPFMDPQNRVNFHMGMVLSFLRGWDLFTQYSILDRGDLPAPATSLPVLEGGFDQRHVVIGIIRRYNKRKKQAPRMFMAR
jgi:hypothetical protein